MSQNTRSPLTCDQQWAQGLEAASNTIEYVNCPLGNLQHGRPMRLHFVFSQQRRQLRKELSFSLERACDQRLELVFHGQRQRRRFGSAEVVIPQPEQNSICERILPSPLVPLRQLLGIDREALGLNRSMRPQQ